jgi:hypothetical protein
MNPYASFSHLLFTCVNAPPSEVVGTVIFGFNEPNAWTPRDDRGQPVTQYFVAERPRSSDDIFPYFDKTEPGYKPHRISFWEPTNCPGNTVMMGNSYDGLSHSVFRLSEASPRTWMNVRLYDSTEYPASILDYYSDYGKIARRLASIREESGWHFFESGPAQSFEDLSNYQKRRIADRLTREIVREYLSKIGLDIRNEAFWRATGSSYLVWQTA